MKDQVIVITGASDGIGAVAVRKLHAMGATIAVVGHSPEKTKLVADSIHAPYYLADFAKFDDVRRLAAQLKQNYPRIDVLMNNAGGIFGKQERELTIDGHEKTLQVNHLAPFLLTNLLITTLMASTASVINTSSVASRRTADLDIHDLELTRGFSPNRAYGNAKLANILFTRGLHQRFHDKGISTAAVHPGIIATNFASDTTSFFRYIYHSPFAKLFLESPESGAEPLVWLASSRPGIDWQSGEYYEKHKLGRLTKQATDETLLNAFWDASIQLTS